MSVAVRYRWTGGELELFDYCDTTDSHILAADSWLVSDGLTLALEAHRQRFTASAGMDVGQFWNTVIAAIPREGDWFPRVEADSNGRLLFRHRSAPPRTRSVVLATWAGPDARTRPRVKGPDLEWMLGVRTSVQAEGAGEAVILTDDRYVAEGATSALLWWRGNILCGPPFDRIDSVTARSVLTLATALGFDTHEEAVTPAELEGTELWALSALHGIRIVTSWVDGPALAEQPGRLAAWRARLDALRRPI